MARRIEKKTWSDMFEKVLKGEKKFDLRLDDFEIDSGDIIVLREWDPANKSYTGRVIEKEVTFVMHTKNLEYWTKEEVDEKGFVIMSLN